MISICSPSRGRPAAFKRMAQSAYELARDKSAFEIVCWLDLDDETAAQYPQLPYVRYIGGDRVEFQSDLWNRCWAVAEGDIAMLGSDDMLFRTQSWDQRVAATFQKHWPDRLGMLYGNDRAPWGAEATFPIVSREWIETVGTFTPPYFVSWFADRWIWEVAEMVDRDYYDRKLQFEHLRTSRDQPMPRDATYAKAERLRAQNRPRRLYLSPPMLRERQEQAMRLCLRIHELRELREAGQ